MDYKDLERLSLELSFNTEKREFVMTVVWDSDLELKTYSEPIQNDTEIKEIIERAIESYSKKSKFFG